jgi:hypothetical protein
MLHNQTIANIVLYAIPPVTLFADQLPCFEVDPIWAKDRASCTAHTQTVGNNKKTK